MTLKETELIGKELVKYGFYRNSRDHQHYRSPRSDYGITVHFGLDGGIWVALITHDIDTHTQVIFNDHLAVFSVEWLTEEHDKLVAAFKFLRS
jgi:hypothetical protein